MALIKGKNTKPELRVRKLLHRLGYRYRLHRNDLPGRPDLVFPARRLVIFVHGCFWHGHQNCRVANIPKTRTEFWEAKFRRNKERDARNLCQLRDAGWDALVVWECETRDTDKLGHKLFQFLGAPGKRQACPDRHGKAA